MGVVDLRSACCVDLGVATFGMVVLIWLFSDLLVALLLCELAGCLVVRINFFCVVWFTSFAVFGFGVSVVFLGFDAAWVLWFPWYFGLVGCDGISVSAAGGVVGSWLVFGLLIAVRM